MMHGALGTILCALLLSLLVHGYSCCKARGTVCTLVGDGREPAKDSASPLTASLLEPLGTDFKSNGDLVIATFRECRIRVLHPNGSVSTLAGSNCDYRDSDNPLTAKFGPIAGLAVDRRSDTVFVTDYFRHLIRAIFRNGTVTTVAGRASMPGHMDSSDPMKALFNYPWNMAFNSASGDLVIAGYYDNTIRVLYANGTVGTLAGDPAKDPTVDPVVDSEDPRKATFYHPSGVAFDQHDNVIVAGRDDPRIRKVYLDNSRQGVETVAGNGTYGYADCPSPALCSMFRVPVSVTVDQSNGNIIVAEHTNNRIRIIYKNGPVATVAGSGEIGSGDNITSLARFYAPSHVTIDKAGNFIVSDRYNGMLRMVCMEGPSLLGSHTGTASLPDIVSNTVVPTTPATNTFGSFSLSATSISASQSRVDSRTEDSLSRTAFASSSSTRTMPLQRSSGIPGTESVLSSVTTAEVARATVAVTTTSSIGSLVGGASGAASIAARSAFITAAADCWYTDDSEEPAWLQYPASFALSGSNAGLRMHGGGVLTVALLIGTFLCMRLFVHPTPGISQRVLHLICGVEAVAIQYYYPNAVQGTITVLRHSSDWVTNIVSCCSIALVTSAVLWRLYVVVIVVPRDVVVTCAVEQGGRARQTVTGIPVMTYGEYFTACRDANRVAVRVVYFCELLCSVLLGAVAGWRPRPNEGSCSSIALFMLCCTAVLLAYQVFFRPYMRKTDMVFSFVFATTQIIQAAVALLVSSTSSSAARQLLAWITMIVGWGLFAQLAVACGWAFYVRSHKQHRLRLEAATATAHDSRLLASIPMLSCSLEPSVGSNPLDGGASGSPL